MPLHRVRASLNLTVRRPLQFLSRSNTICSGLDDNKATFISPSPALSILVAQIQDASASHQLVKTGVHGAVEARTIKFGILLTSLESERMMVQALCDASPGQAQSLIKMAGMEPIVMGDRHKDLLGLKNVLPTGTVLLEANAKLLDPTHRAKFYAWQYTLDGGKTFLGMPSTPDARTTIDNLVPLTKVGFEVSVTVRGQPATAWSQTVYILVQ